MINVTLLNYTPNPERTVALAMRQSRSSKSVTNLNLSDDDVKHLIQLALRLGHFSVFEHVSFTFAIEGISRACSHQLVRHRFFSFTQQSQRYVKLNDSSAFVMPPSIENSDEAKEIYKETLSIIYENYKKLLDLKIPEEDARFLLPNATETKIVATANARELLHFFSLRLASDAQWEIRSLAQKMLELVQPLAPNIFDESYIDKFK